MSTLNFPTNPSLNDTYSFGTKTWIWNGAAWQLQNQGAINGIPIGNSTPSTGAFTELAATGNIVGNTIVSNSGNITVGAAAGNNSVKLAATGTGVVDVSNTRITNLANPTESQDAVTKTYVDTLVATGIHFHQPVRVESPINLTATYNNGTAGVGATLTNAGTQAALVIDDITMVVADRVLIYQQTDETQNGIYVVTSIGSGSTNWILTRASDADTYVINSADGLSEGSSVYVLEGTTGAGELYACNTAGVITFGTTDITFAQIASAQIYSAGTGLSLTGTTFSVNSTQTQITSVGTLSSLSVTGNVTSSGNIAGNFFIGDGSQLTGITGASAFRLSGVFNLTSCISGTGGGGCLNFFAGCCAGICNTTGRSNNFIGQNAGRYNTTGSQNNFFGQSAGCANTTGRYNNFFGDSAGRCNTSGCLNNFFGRFAGCANTTGSYNNFIGSRAGCSNTTGCGNNFFGNYAGRANTTGSNNNFFGWGTGFSNTTGNSNNFIGSLAGRYNTTGNSNNFFGSLAGRCNTTGCFNNFFGRYAGCSNTIGSFNNFIGDRAGCSNTSGSYNTFIGCAAGCRNTSGCNNTFIGQYAGACSTSGSNNTFIGCGAQGSSATVSNEITLGNASITRFRIPGIQIGANNGDVLTFNAAQGILQLQAGGGSGSGVFTLSGSGGTIYSSQAGAGGTGTSNFFAGVSAGLCNTSGSNNTFIGCAAGCRNTTGCFNNFFGRYAGCSNTTGCFNNFIGDRAGCSNTFGCNNNFFGSLAGACNTFGSANNFFGCLAGRSNTTGSYNNFFGCCAGFSNTSGSYNNFFGRGTGRCNTVGRGNTFIGSYSGAASINGFGNTFIGQYAGTCNTSGSYNTFIGRATGCRNTSGSYNTFIGRYTGTANNTGNNNNFFGHLAGSCNTIGSNNTFIGDRAGCCNVSGNNNIFIGCNAGVGTVGLCGVAPMNNTIILGNNAIAAARIQVAWTAVSDIRDKCIFGSVPHGRGFLRRINPIEYAFKDRETGCITDPAGRRRYGFSAQNLLAAEGDHPVIVDNSSDEKLMMTSDYIIPVLVNAVNELSAEIDALKSRLSALEPESK
jgi:hypothetical protein